MTILVTGATGFIGSNIVERLLADGEEVVALSSTPATPRQETSFRRSISPVNLVKGDVRDQRLIEDLIRHYKVKKVVHAAAVTSNAEREKSDGPMIVDVNLVGTAAVAASSANTGVERFVLVGSAGVYDTQASPAGAIISEDAPHRAKSLYAIGKSAAEVIGRRICMLNKLPFCIARVATAFGPWEHDTGFRDTLSPIWQLTCAAREGRAVRIARDKISNWHYGRDAGSAIAILVSHETRHDNYNLGPQFAWPLSQWCERLSRRFPSFRWDIGDATNIELYGENDGGLLSWERFSYEFGPTASYNLDRAFEDYLNWLNADNS